MLSINGLTKRLGGRDRIRDISLHSSGGELVALIGPNGAGKSTLLKSVSGELQPDKGSVLIKGERREEVDRKALARMMAVMGQSPSLSFDFIVEELVRLGRSPHRGTASSAHDPDIIRTALDISGLSSLCGRSVPSLSGGERQRVFFAKALAQLMTRPGCLPGKGKVLLLDEPTSALDLSQQARVMGVARQVADAGGTVLAVLHDLNLASAFADRVAVMVAGQLVGAGVPTDLLTAANLSDWYDCDVRAFYNNQVNAPAFAVQAPRGKV